MEEKQAALEKLQKEAVKYFCEKPDNFTIGRPYNCCESILLTLSKHLNIDSELIPRIGTAIGAGVSLNGLLCGSISSIALIIGIKYGRNHPEESPEKAWEIMDRYVSDFIKRFGYVNCRQLTGLDLKTPEGLKEYFTRVHDQACTERIKFAIEKALEILTNEENK
jgi:C_GCAxxG_C_C family probable redox protein